MESFLTRPPQKIGPERANYQGKEIFQIFSLFVREKHVFYSSAGDRAEFSSAVFPRGKKLRSIYSPKCKIQQLPLKRLKKCNVVYLFIYWCFQLTYGKPPFRK